MHNIHYVTLRASQAHRPKRDTTIERVAGFQFNYDLRFDHAHDAREPNISCMMLLVFRHFLMRFLSGDCRQRTFDASRLHDSEACCF
jgi:hypothetical protein